MLFYYNKTLNSINVMPKGSAPPHLPSPPPGRGLRRRGILLASGVDIHDFYDFHLVFLHQIKRQLDGKNITAKIYFLEKMLIIVNI